LVTQRLLALHYFSLGQLGSIASAVQSGTAARSLVDTSDRSLLDVIVRTCCGKLGAVSANYRHVLNFFKVVHERLAPPPAPRSAPAAEQSWTHEHVARALFRAVRGVHNDALIARARQLFFGGAQGPFLTTEAHITNDLKVRCPFPNCSKQYTIMFLSGPNTNKLFKHMQKKHNDAVLAGAPAAAGKRPVPPPVDAAPAHPKQRLDTSQRTLDTYRRPAGNTSAAGAAQPPAAGVVEFVPAAAGGAAFVATLASSSSAPDNESSF
jgi:hypothetical protein